MGPLTPAPKAFPALNVGLLEFQECRENTDSRPHLLAPSVGSTTQSQSITLRSHEETQDSARPGNLRFNKHPCAS